MLRGTQAELGGAGECMMVVVPRLAHGEQTDVWNIVALDSMSAEEPIALSGVVSEVTNEPVADQRDRHAYADAPDDKANASEEEEQNRPRQLLKHPGSLQQPMEWIVCDGALDLKSRRVGQAVRAGRADRVSRVR